MPEYNSVYNFTFAMGKSDVQREFDTFVDDQNAIAPSRHTLRGLGLDGNKKPNSGSQEAVDLVIGELCKAIEATLNDKEGISPSLDLHTLLGADIRKWLTPLAKDNSNSVISMLDVVTLGLTDIVHIKKFLKRHGSNLDDPKDLKYVNDVLREAVAFFDKIIAENRPKDKINNSLRSTGSIEGVSRIFQTAAGKKQRQLVPQACGLLRIAAAIDFLNRDPLLSGLVEAEEELTRIHSRYFSSKQGKTYFNTGTPGEIPMEIMKCELRTKKRERMIAKLLHKPQNSTKEVVDHIGMRVETKSALDALRFLYFTFFKPDTAIFPGMTIRTGETKQLLFDEGKLMEALQSPRKAALLVKQLAKPTMEYSDLVTINDDETGVSANKFSAQKYRAIQLTFDLPLINKGGQRIHFPVEIQIVDHASRVVNESAAPHGDYMERQTNAVRARLMSNNLLNRFNETRDVDDEEGED